MLSLLNSSHYLTLSKVTVEYTDLFVACISDTSPADHHLLKLLDYFLKSSVSNTIAAANKPV